ncbi:TadE/TadG family type IV pilus assembly protein [Photobacterium kagoshimensis]|uniref:TadE/TadG family type IV pilus assembly protein n=1 Tax=Photobacterium kagoshimensis TaxID=2910242 RepID=UPI003D0ED4D3
MKRSHRLQAGVASIEFALGFIVLWFMTVMIMDIGLRNYTVAVVNFAASEVTRDIKVLEIDSEDKFEKEFRKKLKENAFSLWGVMSQNDEFIVDMKLYPNIAALAQDHHVNMYHASQAPIASYQLTYNYKPLIRLSGYSSFPIHREVIAVQEFARRGV